MLLFLILLFARDVAGDKPNILVLFADDMGYGDLSINGHPTISTPNIDKLAMEGIRYTQWYSAFHICSPSRASMMTGRLPIRTGVVGGWTGGVFSSTAIGGLSLNETTWPELLRREAGYRTMCIGKWHLGQREEYLPTRRGFDSYLGIPYSVDMGPSAWHSNDQPPLPLMANESVLEQPVNLNVLSERYVGAARSFVQSNSSLFALYYAFSHVHVPDFANRRFCDSSQRGRYGDAVAELDWSVGRVMEVLPSNTLTFFTSDNGPWLIQRLAGGSAGLFFEGKSTTWEGGIREPAIIHWPGRVKPGGRRSAAMASTCDIFATVLNAAGIASPSDRIIDGVDLTPSFLVGSDNTTALRECLFIYKGRPGADCASKRPSACPGLWAVRCGKYKAHYVTSYSGASCHGAHNLTCLNADPTFHDPPLLFDVEADPSEKWPLDPEAFHDQLDVIAKAKRRHELQLGIPPQDEILKGSDPRFAVCGCPNSTVDLPQYPNCTCNPENWQLDVCSPVDDDVQLTLSSSAAAYDAAYAYADAFEKEKGYRPY